MEKDIVSKISEDILKNRAKIIDEFCIAYIACRSDYSEDPKKIIPRLKLVEKRVSLTTTEFSFELKRGPLAS